MTKENESARRSVARDVWWCSTRWLLGGVFVYLGLNKALHPVEFLKLVREYQILDYAPVLTFVAATLPWVEVVCGLLLVAGVAVRGTAALLLAMLVGFTAAIVERALGLQGATGLPFCAVAFDCGCGAGEVLVCRKLAENTVLALFALGQVWAPSQRLCGRHALLARDRPAR